MRSEFCLLLVVALTVVNINFGRANDDVEVKDLSAAFGQACTPEGPLCLQNKGLDCIGGICNCTISSEEKFIHIEEKEGCVRIAQSSDKWVCRYHEQCTESEFGKDSHCLQESYDKTEPGNCECKPGKNCKDSKIVSESLPPATQETDWLCKHDFQCTNSALGEFSKCNKPSETIFGTCVCHDTGGKGRGIIWGYDNICYIQKELGQSCNNDGECNGTIAGEAICRGSGVGDKKGVCQCADKFHFEPTYRECLKVGTLHSVCKSDTQCKHEEALGPLSRCQETSKTCDCWDTEEFGKKDTKFHEGRCYYSRGVNESCTDKIECVLGYHRNADCWVHESYNGAKVCQCSEDHQCDHTSNLLPTPLTVAVLVSVILNMSD